MTKISDLHRRWRKDAAYTDAYDALDVAIDLVRTRLRIVFEPGCYALTRRLAASWSSGSIPIGGRPGNRWEVVDGAEL
jgi:hypothetical protein